MTLVNILIVFSSLSFLGYGISYFVSPKMKSEFVRFGLAKLGTLTAVLEIVGALGLLLGLKSDFFLLISSGGLSLLMFFGVIVRLKVKDGIIASSPATLFMLLNLYIFVQALKIYLA